MPRTDPPRLAILGAGPVGLEAALYAAMLKLPFTVYERGNLGDHLRQWGHVRLFSPFGMNCTALGRARLKAEQPNLKLPADGDVLTGREHRTAYLEPLSRSPLLTDRLRTETTVLHVGRRGMLKGDFPGDVRRAGQPFRLIVRGPKGERSEEADVILDCTGTYSRPNGLGDGGLPALGEAKVRSQIAFGLEDILGDKRNHYADRTTLVIGGGYSAATTVGLLATLAEKHPATWAIWLARNPKSQPLRRFANDPLRERDQLAVRANNLATRGDANVEFRPSASVESIEVAGPDGSFRVRGQVAGKPTTWDVERIIANVGYSPDTDLYRELQIHECYATLGPMSLAAQLKPGSDCLTAPSTGPASLRCPEPNFYILGAKSYGRNSSFLMRTGFEQVRDVFTLITGKADLDLYKKA
jgi:thioredoxin reductase